MAFEIREARPDEHAEAGRVTALAYREFVPEGSDDWPGYLERIADIAGRADRTTILVAVAEGRILGSATLELDSRVDPDRTLAEGEAHIRMLGVDPDARGRGIGKALMRACIDLAAAANKRRLTLNTTQRMRAAQRMYESLAFDRNEDETMPGGFVLLSYSKQL